VNSEGAWVAGGARKAQFLSSMGTREKGYQGASQNWASAMEGGKKNTNYVIILLDEDSSQAVRVFKER